MFAWLKRWRAPEVPLTGAPAVRRLKSYQAGSGYVYQYVYRGQRRKGRDVEYVFDSSADRKTWFPVSITVPDSSVAGWEHDHRRTLTGTERYAVAKLALMARFDEAEAPGLLREPITVSDPAARQILATLGI